MRLPRFLPRILALIAAMAAFLIGAELSRRRAVYQRLAEHHAREASRFAHLARSSRNAAQALESFDEGEAAKRAEQLASLQASLPGELAQREEFTPALSRVRADLAAKLDELTSQRRAEVRKWRAESSSYEQEASRHDRLKRYYERKWW